MPETEEPTTETPNIALPFTCKKCKSGFATVQGLTVHIARAHASPAKQAAWNASIQRAQRRPEVIARIQNTKRGRSQTNGALFQCHVCGHTNNSKGSLLSHVQRIHGNAETRKARILLRTTMPVKKLGRPIIDPTDARLTKRREYQNRWAIRRRKAAQAVVAAPGAEPAAPNQACPNFCPNCGFGLAAVSVALTINK